MGWSTSRIGERLQSADRQRAAAAQARQLAAHLTAFNSCVDGNLAGTEPGGEEGMREGGVDDVFHDPAGGLLRTSTRRTLHLLHLHTSI